MIRTGGQPNRLTTSGLSSRRSRQELACVAARPTRAALRRRNESVPSPADRIARAGGRAAAWKRGLRAAAHLCAAVFDSCTCCHVARLQQSPIKGSSLDKKAIARAGAPWASLSLTGGGRGVNYHKPLTLTRARPLRRRRTYLADWRAKWIEALWLIMCAQRWTFFRRT